MTKAKRKQSPKQHTLWWHWFTYGVLAHCLTFMIWYPVRHLIWWHANTFAFLSLALLLFILLWRTAKRYGLRRPIIALIVICISLSSWQAIITLRTPYRCRLGGYDTPYGWETSRVCLYPLNNCYDAGERFIGNQWVAIATGEKDEVFAYCGA